MKAVRTTAADVQVGETLLTIGQDRTVNARVLEITACTPGQHVRGPRGGQYALTAAGAAQRIVLVTAHARPIVTLMTPVTVLREAE